MPGPTVFICDECVELCLDIIGEENKSSLTKSGDKIPTPKEIRKVLGRLMPAGNLCGAGGINL